MGSRLIINGRSLGGGRYGGDPKCLCGASVVILGRCSDCHAALRRRRVGLPPTGEAEERRLRGFLEKHQATLGKCKECEALVNEPHRKGCRWEDL